MRRLKARARLVLRHPALRALARKVGNPLLWRTTERTLPRACAIGLFVAWLPIPGQMVVAAAAAILLSGHLPLSVGLVWVSNPVTWIPMAYLAYYVGALVLGSPGAAQDSLQPEGMAQGVLDLGAEFVMPALVGSGIMACVCGLLGFSVGFAVARFGSRVRRWLASQRPAP